MHEIVVQTTIRVSIIVDTTVSANIVVCTEANILDMYVTPPLISKIMY